MERPTVADDDARILSIALFRARRVVAPVVVLGIAGSFVLSIPSGIPLTAPIIGQNAACIALGVLLWVALARERVPLKYAHLALIALVGLAPVNTILTQYVTRQSTLAFPFLLELALAAAVVVSPRWLAGATSVAVAAWVPLALRDAGPQLGIQLGSIAGGSVCAFITSLYMRRSLDLALTREADHVATTKALEHELAERKRAETEREQLRDQFVHAQRHEAVGTLAAGLAHDMNNVLGVVLTQAELLLEDSKSEPERDEIRQIVLAAERGAQLTRGLLAYTRQGPTERATLPLGDVLSAMEPVLRRLVPALIRVEWQREPCVVVSCDPSQLQQALINLCMNAADAIVGPGVVTVTTGGVDLDEAAAARLRLERGRYARFTVRDTGSGMSESVRARVFEPFYTTKALGKGTGLGLAMVHGTILAHGGAIEVESAPGRGATFLAYLPEVVAGAELAAVRADAAPLPASGTTARTVLVVDDEPGVRLVVSRVLKGMGFEVLTAEDGAEGLDVFRAHRDVVTLVILDMQMPVMGGADCLEALRAMGNVRVLVVSGYADPGEVDRVLRAGAAGFLSKPFKPDALRAKVQAIVRDSVRAPSETARAAGPS